MSKSEYEFLEGFDKRMNTIGSISSFIIKLINTQKFKDILSQSELINLAVAVLCFLLEKTLTREGATILQVKDFINYVVNDCYIKDKKNTMDLENNEEQRVPIEDAVILDIARFIIRDVFMNGGEYYSFEIFNFDKNKGEVKNFQLVKDKIDRNNELKYILSDLGNDFLLRTKEIDQHLQITMKQIVTKEFIKRKDFKGANDVAKELLTAIHMEKQIIDNFIDRVKTSNILSIEKNEYKNRIDGIFNTLEEQKYEFDNIIELLNDAEKEFISLGQYDDKIKDFKITKETLSNIRNEHSKLFEKRYLADTSYEDALNNAMLIGLTKRFDFNETIIEPVKNNIEFLENIVCILRPLLSVNMPKHFNIFTAFEEQQIVKEEGEKDSKELEVIEDTTYVNSKELEAKELKVRYFKSLQLILDYCIENNGQVVELRQLYNSLTSSQKEYFIEDDNGQVFFKMILCLYSPEVYYGSELLEKESFKDENFNLSNIFKELCENEPKYKKIYSFEVFNNNPKDKITLQAESEKNEDGITRRITREFEITNYKFKVVQN